MNYKDFKQLTITIVILMLGCFFIGSLSGCGASKNQFDRCEKPCKDNGGVAWVDAFWFNDHLCTCANGAHFDSADAAKINEIKARTK